MTMNRIRPYSAAVIAAVVGALLAGPVSAVQPGSTFDTKPLPDSLRQAPAPSASRRAEGKLDTAMSAVADAARISGSRALDVARDRGVRTLAGLVHAVVTVEAGSADRLRAIVATRGGQVSGVGDSGSRIQAFLPPGILRQLAELPDVRGLTQPARVFPASGPYMTEGLGAMGGSAWHSAGYDGTGVKIGIIDVDFAGHAALQGTELPSIVTVRNFVDGEDPNIVDGTDPHGTACAEVIHDIAPAAQLYLAKVGSEVDIEEAADWLQSQGVNVISSSIGIYNVTPGDGTGYFEDIVNAKRNAGILWFTAASNDRQAHWGGAFSDPDGDHFHNFAAGWELNFFGDGLQNASFIPAGYPFCVFLRWSDWSPPVRPDLDLYLIRWDGLSGDWEEIARSENDQASGAFPWPVEQACIETYGADAAYGFYLYRYSGSGNPNMEIFAPELGRLDRFVQQRSLSNLADVDSAVTVGALDVNAPYAQEFYSSEGPTNGPGGSASGGKLKPDLSGFANVSTASYGTVLPFNGTSAATPHAAGAGALVLDASTGPYGPTELEAVLTDRALDQGVTGPDNDIGYGRLNLGSPPLATDLELISALASADSVLVGNHLQITATARNNGANEAAGVWIRQTVPNWATLLSAPAGCIHTGATSYGGRTRGGLVRCPIGSLSPTASATRTITIGMLQSGSWSSTGSVAFLGADSLLGNESLPVGGTATYPAGQTTRCNLLGGAGNDTVTGNSNVNVICTFGGNDIIDGRGGNDVANGGPGRDRTSSTAASAGVLIDLAAKVTACHPSGTACGQGSDTLISVEEGAGGRYADRLIGSSASNRLYGNSGNDYEAGGGGADRLDGGAGNDRLLGGSGNDTLLGRTGIDYFDGGTGTDSCPDRISSETKISCP